MGMYSNLSCNSNKPSSIQIKILRKDLILIFSLKYGIEPATSVASV